jgi:hypothetical protein
MSKIDIINRCLLKLGEAPISSFNSAVYGKSYEVLYDDMKRMLLSMYPWRFAIGSKKLAKDIELYNKRAKYCLPNDYLMLLRVLSKQNHLNIDSVVDYEIVENFVVCDDGNGISIEYVKNIDDERNFSPLFREALVAKIASEISMRVKNSLELKQIFETEFYNLIRQAEFNNEIIKDVENMPDNSWVLCRKAW